MGSFTYDVITWGRGGGGEVAADDEVSYFSYGEYNIIQILLTRGDGRRRGFEKAIFVMTSYINPHQLADLS